MQPLYYDGKLWFGEAAKDGGDDIVTLDADSGDELWRWDTTDNPESDHVPSGGIWYQPAIDESGDAYYGIANGYYSFKSPKDTQNERKYTDSVVKIKDDGKLDWYYQGVVNDFYDWDMQLSPVLTQLDGKDVIVSSGKMGYIYVTDASSGELKWKQPIGQHNGHDTDGQKQLDGTLKLTPPFDVLPGPYGGNETPMAVDDGVIYSAVVNMAGHVKTEKDLANPILPVDFATGKGELIATNLADGKEKWSVDLPTMALGAMTVSNDLVFTTTFDGKVHAYSTEDGKEVWSDDMKVGTNSPLAIAGDYLFTAAAFPQGKGQKPMFYVYQLGASETTPPKSSNEDNTGSATSGGDEKTESTSAQGAQEVNVGVKEGELKFSTDTLSAKAGKVTFTFTNPDAIAHDFQIELDGKNIGGTKLISNGDSDSFTVDLKAGDYDFYCTPHRSAGMVGKLTVS
jgi:plastocyanin/outer membrane protein assembly factor BamB